MKIRNTILTTLCIMGLGGALALTPILNNKQNNNDVNNVIRQENKKQVVYNEELYLITFSDEDFTYTYENLFNALLEYNDETFLQNNNVRINDYAINYLSISNQQISFEDTDNSGNTYLLTGVNNSYEVEPYIFYSGDETIWEVIFDLEAEVYTTLKNAIELDMQPKPMGDSITEAVTSGLGLIGSLANEFITGFTALLWNSTSNTLTSFGTFALVFLGIAITMAVIKLVLAILRGNTGA